jgi:hypothetical protein
VVRIYSGAYLQWCGFTVVRIYSGADLQRCGLAGTPWNVAVTLFSKKTLKTPPTFLSPQLNWARIGPMIMEEGHKWSFPTLWDNSTILRSGLREGNFTKLPSFFKERHFYPRARRALMAGFTFYFVVLVLVLVVRPFNRPHVTILCTTYTPKSGLRLIASLTSLQPIKFDIFYSSSISGGRSHYLPALSQFLRFIKM